MKVQRFALSAAISRTRRQTRTQWKISTVSQIGIMASLIFGLSATLPAQSSVVRLQSVVIPADSGLLQELLSEFEQVTGFRVNVERGEQVYELARQGQADLVLSHYGQPTAGRRGPGCQQHSL